MTILNLEKTPDPEEMKNLALNRDFKWIKKEQHEILVIKEMLHKLKLK